MLLEVLYIMYTVLYHEQNDYIITVVQFEEVNLVENKLNEEEDKSILASVDESSE